MNINRRSFLTTLAGLGVAITALPRKILSAAKIQLGLGDMPLSTGPENKIFLNESGVIHGPARIFEIGSYGEAAGTMDVFTESENVTSLQLQLSKGPMGVVRWLSCPNGEIEVAAGETLTIEGLPARTLYRIPPYPAYVEPEPYVFDPSEYEYEDVDDDDINTYDEGY